TKASYNDIKALENFAKNVDIVTYEFENIPIETVRLCARYATLWPDEQLLSIAQNRLSEKQFLNDIGIETAPWAPVTSAENIDTLMTQWKTEEIILKTTRFGYDGKSQLKYRAGDKSSDSWNKLGGNELIAEGIIDFDYEISAIIARDAFGGTAIYPVC